MSVRSVDGMIYPLITRPIYVPLSSEWAGRGFIFRPLVDQRTIQPVYWFPLGISFDEILHYFGANFFEEVAKISYDRKVSPNGLFLLHDVRYTDRNYWPDDYQTQQKIRADQTEQQNSRN